MTAFAITQGDTLPTLDATLARNGTAEDVTGATVTLYYRLRAGGLVLSKAATLVTPASGIVRVTFATTDTATTGVYDAHFRVVFTDTSVLTFPNNGFFTLTIFDAIAV